MSGKLRNWWLLIPGRGLIITNRLLPSDINDDKKSHWSEFAIPGLDYSPTDHVRNDDTKISFTVPFIDRSTAAGNSLQLNQVEVLRHSEIDLGLTTENQWAKNPTVWYSGWGTHRPPLPCIVRRAKFKHSRDFTDRRSTKSTWTEVDFELEYIESHPQFQAYLKVIAASAYAGAAQQLTGFSGEPF